MNLKLNYEAFFLQKKDHQPEEYEDAFSIKEIPEDEYRFSVADGATESSFAGIWARLLTDGYSNGTEIDSLQSTWLSQIESMELPWYSQQKAEQGAYAAFLGLTIFSKKNSQINTYEAISVGDCCFFHIRGDNLITSFPIDSSSEFDNSPELISSINKVETKNAEFQIKKGKWIEGDMFLLMSDAIASWFLSKIENKENSIERLKGLSNQNEFIQLVEQERKIIYDSGLPALKNDDVTLVKVTLTK